MVILGMSKTWRQTGPGICPAQNKEEFPLSKRSRWQADQPTGGMTGCVGEMTKGKGKMLAGGASKRRGD